MRGRYEAKCFHQREAVRPADWVQNLPLSHSAGAPKRSCCSEAQGICKVACHFEAIESLHLTAASWLHQTQVRVRKVTCSYGTVCALVSEAATSQQFHVYHMLHHCQAHDRRSTRRLAGIQALGCTLKFGPTTAAADAGCQDIKGTLNYFSHHREDWDMASCRL